MIDRTMRFEFSPAGVWTYHAEDGTEVVLDDGFAGAYISTEVLIARACVADRAIAAKAKREQP